MDGPRRLEYMKLTTQKINNHSQNLLHPAN